MYNLDELQQKWQPVLEHPDLPEIKDAHKRASVATLLLVWFAVRCLILSLMMLLVFSP
mgnify:CR=1 FL=1